MARPTKQGLDYFPFDVGFFGDKNIRILKARYHSDGIAVYVKILCDVYKEGYYLSVESWEDYIFVIADEIGATIDKVQQIITFLRSRAMVRIFEKDELTGYDLDAVITSHGIQSRYAAAVKSRRRKSINEIKRGFWLLSEDEEQELNAFYNCGENEGFYSKNPDKFSKNPDKFSKNPDKFSKNDIKESKVKESKVSTYVPRARDMFFETYPDIREDPNVDDSKIDYEKLIYFFERSKKFLQSRKDHAWICSHYEDILNGKYDDYSDLAKPVQYESGPIQDANARAELERWYANRREVAERRADEINATLMKDEGFKSISVRLRSIIPEIARAEISNKSKYEKLLKEERNLKMKRHAILARNGMEEDDLLPKWHCKKCSDTGYLPNGKMCDCYEKENEND